MTDNGKPENVDEELCVCVKNRFQTKDYHESFALLLDAPDNPTLLCRPRQPWEDWKPVEPSASGDDCEVEYCQGDEVTSSILDTPSPELNDFLLEIERENESPHLRELNINVQDYVSSVVKDIVHNLSRKYPENFESSTVHTVGSVGEGTKVGIYDEFDFIIEVPSVSKRLRQQIPSLEFVTVESRRNFKKAMELLGECRKELFAQLLSSLPKFCTLQGSEPAPTKSATTNLQLSYTPSPESTPVNICCDIVFCFPLMRMSGSNPRCKICKRLQDTRSVHIMDGMHYRKATVFAERDKLVHSNISVNVRRVYRWTKLLVRDLLPPLSDFHAARLGDVIPSYYLKQIILYMMDEFPQPDAWQEQYLSLRVNQVMSKLQNCIEKKTVSSYFRSETTIFKDLSDESDIAKQYLPVITNLLNGAARGDDSALSSLTSLRQVTAEFKVSAITEVKLLKFCHILNNYCKGVLEPESLDEGSKSKLHEYATNHMRGIIELKEEGKQLHIIYKDGEFSLREFYKRFMIIEGFLDNVVWNVKFPDKWRERYNMMLKKCMPTDILKSIEEPLAATQGFPGCDEDERKSCNKYLHKLNAVAATRYEQIRDMLAQFEDYKKSRNLHYQAKPLDDSQGESWFVAHSEESQTGSPNDSSTGPFSDPQKGSPKEASVLTQTESPCKAKTGSVIKPHADPNNASQVESPSYSLTAVQKKPAVDADAEVQDNHEKESLLNPSAVASGSTAHDQPLARLLNTNYEQSAATSDNQADVPSKSLLDLLRESDGRDGMAYHVGMGEQQMIDVLQYSISLVKEQCETLGELQMKSDEKSDGI